MIRSRVALALLLGGARSSVEASDSAWYPYSSVEWSANVGANSNSICQYGQEQSPVDFPNCGNPVTRSAPTMSWATQDVMLANNGHTVQLTAGAAEGSRGKMAYAIADLQKSYSLVQCHFHHGSEHTIGGKQFPMEVHCVHTFDSDQEAAHYGVFGVFYETGSSENAFLRQFEDQLPTHADSVSNRRLSSSEVSFDLFGNPMNSTTKRRLADAVEVAVTGVDFQSLYAGVDLTNFYNYGGSFTTPPCTEAVDFYIFMQPAILGQVQLDKFKTAMGWNAAGGNYRPPQPLNQRTIYGCDVLPEPKVELPWYPYQEDNWASQVGSSSAAVCASGSEQSPIDFATCASPSDRSAIDVTWANQEVTLKNNGHTVVLEAQGSAPGGMTVGGHSYTLVQCHFHWASEHTVGGMQYPFEAHCVHVKDDSITDGVPSHYGVFGIFYQESSTATNAFLNAFDDHLPTYTRRLRSADVGLNVLGHPMDAKRKLAGTGATSSWTGPLEFTDLYGDNARTKYWDYSGSFTTPPCTEAVDFYIMMDPADISSGQLSKFRSAIGWTSAGGNFRPPQGLGSRVVSGCARLADTATIVQDAVSAGLPTNMQSLIADEVSTQMKNVLDAEQGQHTGMLTALVVLASLILVVMVFMAVALCILYKKSTA